LVAFQAARENQSSIYVFNESDGTLTRVLPIAGSVDQPLQPRWHPRRKEIVYVCDYTVEAWSNSSGSLSVPDQLNPLTPVVNGQRRTRYPSVWALRLENP
jgi:Tol biopolymer transport system component